MSQTTRTLVLNDFTWGELKREIERAGVDDDHKIHLIDIDSDSKHKATLTLDDHVFLTNYSNM